jgi:hypothetical protein
VRPVRGKVKISQVEKAVAALATKVPVAKCGLRADVEAIGELVIPEE